MTKICLISEIGGKKVIANVTDSTAITFENAKNSQGIWPSDKLPNYVPTNIDKDSISNRQITVPLQDAIKSNDVDFRLNPLSNDIGEMLVEDLRRTAETKYHAKNCMVRLDWEKPTCLIFGVKDNKNSGNSAPLQPTPAPKSTNVQHESTSPAPKSTMPTNNENLLRKQYERMIARIIQEYENKVEELKKELRKQRHRHEIELSKLDKQYKRQLTLQNQQKQPQLKLPKKDQQVADWVEKNWKYLEPTVNRYFSNLYLSHNEKVRGGEDGKGDQMQAKRYKQYAINIISLQFKELFNQTKQKSRNAQLNKDKRKPKGEELGK